LRPFDYTYGYPGTPVLSRLSFFCDEVGLAVRVAARGARMRDPRVYVVNVAEKTGLDPVRQVRVLELAREMGLLELGTVALDSTKIPVRPEGAYHQWR
jgi:hypothetical protein